jgi:hypothetical protein
MVGSGDGSYAGALGAFPYAFGASGSRLFRSYVVLGGLVALLASFLFGGALLDLLAKTFRTSGGTFTFSRAFVVVVALGVVGPILAPVLLVARRHRRGDAVRDGGAGAESRSVLAYDRAMATAGYAFICSIYLALVVSAPPGARDDPPAILAPVVEFLYGLPQVAGLVPLLLAAAGIYAVHRAYR